MSRGQLPNFPFVFWPFKSEKRLGRGGSAAAAADEEENVVSAADPVSSFLSEEEGGLPKKNPPEETEAPAAGAAPMEKPCLEIDPPVDGLCVDVVVVPFEKGFGLLALEGPTLLAAAAPPKENPPDPIDPAAAGAVAAPAPPLVASLPGLANSHAMHFSTLFGE